MKYVLDSNMMKQCDVNTMEHFGMLSAVLMERAAYAVYEEIVTARPGTDTKILVVCGAGNNGGDGFALARLLFLKGYAVEILFAGREDHMTVETARQFSIANKYMIPICRELPEKEYDVIADSIFGIGLCRNVTGGYAGLIDELNKKSGYKVAVDICSGLSADNGAVMGTAFRADLTVTFGFAKSGHLLFPGAEFSGRVVVKEIGIDEKSLLNLTPTAGMPGMEDLALLPKRRSRTNKGSYGKLMIFAGSCNMAGAAVFAAKAAYAAGCGLVRVVTAACNRQIVQTLVPEAVLTTYDDGTDMEMLACEMLSQADAAVIGPGIGVDCGAGSFLHAVLQHAQIPCLIDADGLNLIARNKEWLHEKNTSVIVTPHVGEMSRLCGCTIQDIMDDLVGYATRFSKDYDVITVLKDAHTVTGCPNGFSYINTSGNNGMATAGSGDVLAGLIGSLLGQGMEAEPAAFVGVYLHGLAGDAAARHVGRPGLTASGLIESVREVMKEGTKR